VSSVRSNLIVDRALLSLFIFFILSESGLITDNCHFTDGLLSPVKREVV
jgi:hypothetical protein